LPEDVRTRVPAAQQKSGLVPNFFLALVYRPEEFRAFFADQDALLEKDRGLSKAEREMKASGPRRCPGAIEVLQS